MINFNRVTKCKIGLKSFKIQLLIKALITIIEHFFEGKVKLEPTAVPELRPTKMM